MHFYRYYASSDSQHESSGSHHESTDLDMSFGTF